MTHIRDVLCYDFIHYFKDTRGFVLGKRCLVNYFLNLTFSLIAQANIQVFIILSSVDDKFSDTRGCKV